MTLEQVITNFIGPAVVLIYLVGSLWFAREGSKQNNHLKEENATLRENSKAYRKMLLAGVAEEVLTDLYKLFVQAVKMESVSCENTTIFTIRDVRLGVVESSFEEVSLKIHKALGIFRECFDIIGLNQNFAERKLFAQAFDVIDEAKRVRCTDVNGGKFVEITNNIQQKRDLFKKECVEYVTQQRTIVVPDQEVFDAIDSKKG